MVTPTWGPASVSVVVFRTFSLKSPLSAWLLIEAVDKAERPQTREGKVHDRDGNPRCRLGRAILLCSCSSDEHCSAFRRPLQVRLRLVVIPPILCRSQPGWVKSRGRLSMIGTAGEAITKRGMLRFKSSADCKSRDRYQRPEGAAAGSDAPIGARGEPMPGSPSLLKSLRSWSSISPCLVSW